jgi:hypothetical protein
MLCALALTGSLAACGGTSRHVQSPSRSVGIATTRAPTSATTPTHTPTQRNESKEGNTYLRGADDLVYSHVGSEADRRAIAAVLTAYYQAAAAEDGAKACSLIYSIFAEEIPETYGASPPGPPSLRGRTCAEVMTKVFASHHKQIVADSASLKVTLVRIRERRGLALLQFRSGPERDIPMHLERGRWRVEALLDSGMT